MANGTDVTVDNSVVAIPKWILNACLMLGVPVVALVGHLTIKVATIEAAQQVHNDNAQKLTKTVTEQTEAITSLRLQVERLVAIDLYRKVERLEARVSELAQKASKRDIPL